MADFFISRSGNDKDIAFGRRVRDVLPAAGYDCVLQDTDFGHTNFMAAMDAALRSDARVIALLSADYFLSDNCMAEAYGALAGDVLNRRQRLIPLRVAECDPPGLLANIAWLDLDLEHKSFKWEPVFG